MQEDNLAWSFPFIHGFSCIKAIIGMTPEDLYGISGKSPEIDAIEEALKRDDLYDIYVRGAVNLDNYRFGNYINKYIKPAIQERLWLRPYVIGFQKRPPVAGVFYLLWL